MGSPHSEFFVTEMFEEFWRDAMSLFAEIDLAPGGVIAWVVVGLVAGALAGFVMKGGGYGVIGDLVMGLAGALIGGFLFGLFVTGTTGFWGSIAVAFVGACALIAVVRAFAPGRTNL
jgi:uncharacterized membrane protein YeaQ/YmgE (transglycosylase-associated protein family)